MRITQNMLNSDMLYNLDSSLQRMDRLQEMLSTGKKVSKPSHDPIVASRSMLFRTNISENDQFRSNTDEATNWLDQAESTISQGNTILTRVKELVTQAANETNGPEERQKIGAEITQLRDQLGVLANTTFAGKYIFSGTEIETKAFDESAVPPDLSAAINSDAINIEVSTGIKIPINVPADELFKGTNSETTFDMLDKLITDLNSPTLQDMQGHLGKIQNHIENFLKVQASVGARTNRIELTQNRLDTQRDGTEKMLSDGEDADLAKVIMDLQNNENVHRAALSAGSRIIQPTLLDFLR
ncbi:flagellar hook-associated protein FlgL [Aneurinibacillus uraniidurans]|uniref:flagellar hook-associated protein FlgL n=1 Tax=Aneurinibacillus uraniidurans TaxID=2966586 RepID=UPI002349C14F|nr:flagellar hook-associated protein FlgL [Aneurinibacillus sp. B1]WCN38133.1 flagellar hook-associated protein FlgL [Aneurinibacillus sp. B1]